MARRLAVILFTDLVDYSAIARADEDAALRLVREQESLVRPLLDQHKGRRVRSIGDGRLIEFPEALDAAECAVELQRRAHERNLDPEAEPLRIQAGIHLGEVERRGIGVSGGAVEIASSIGPLAEPGGVCLTEPVYVRVRTRLPYPLERLGPRDLKRLREPIAVYHVLLPWLSASAPRAVRLGTRPPEGPPAGATSPPSDGSIGTGPAPAV